MMRRLLTLVFSLVLSTAIVQAASIEFTQDGWDSGGSLAVSFTGYDSDGDGFLVQSELAAFHATWATPLGVGTSWGLSEIEPDGFFFAGLGDYLMFTRNPEFSLVNSAFEGEALASVFDAFLFPVDTTSTAPLAAPEPGGLAALGLTGLWIGRWLKKKGRG